uniref:Transthyretin-like family protein n=1 Tax=Ascaris lumbricoides TaxID=6252 RepID=A0A0M3IF45_ASCLU
MLFEILLTTLLMIDVTDSFLGNTQDIIVTGMVGCGNRAQPNAIIELREYDRFRKRYLLYLLSYRPTLRIIHFCNPKMLFEILLTTLLMIDVTDSFLGNTQDIIVTGMVGCGNRAQPNAVIELREYDRFPDSDDVLGRTKTGRRGKFKLIGRHKEVMGIEPYLRIKHHCVNGFYRRVCAKRSMIKLVC